MIEFGHGTHVGLRRSHNEDTYHADATNCLWLVADGMGGHDHGEVASALARDTVVEQLAAGASLDDAIHEADRTIISHAPRSSGMLPMGTTIAALHLSRQQYCIAWVGDSRVYLFDKSLSQLSQDHSYVRELVDQGTISEQEARHHPRRNVVTQALGVTAPEDLEVSTREGPAEPGMQFLLCSDGLTEEVEDQAIGAVLARRDLSAQECVDQLILLALDGGGKDNITVLLVRVN